MTQSDQAADVTLPFTRGAEKSASALKTISEAAELLEVPQHVLRFWETKFTQIKPLKRNGGRRYYRPDDIEVLLQIKNLLYKQGYTIKGAQKAFDKKPVDEIKKTFSPVALGSPTVQDNDNLPEDDDQPELFAIAAPAVATAPVSSPPKAEIMAIRNELMAISAELRAGIES